MPTRRDRPVDSTVLVELEDTSNAAVPASSPGRHTRSRLVPLGVGAAVAVAVVAGGLVARDDEERSGLLRVSSSATVQWATELETAVVFEVVATDDMVIAAIGWDTTLVGLDRRTGAPRWSRLVAKAHAPLVDVAGDVAVVMSWDSEPPEVIAIDTHDGRELWTRSLAAEETVVTHRHGVLVTRSRRTETAVGQVDARHGQVLATASGRLVGTQPDGVLVQRGDQLVLLDWRTLRSRQGVQLGGRHVRDVPAASVGNGLVALNAFDGGTSMFASRDGELFRLWAKPAWMVAANLHADDPVVLVQSAASRSSDEGYAVLDARSGGRLWPVLDDPAPGQVVLGDNGFVVVDHAAGSDGPVITGHRLDASRMWRVALEPFTDVVPVDGGVATIWTDVGTGTTTLTLYA